MFITDKEARRQCPLCWHRLFLSTVPALCNMMPHIEIENGFYLNITWKGPEMLDHPC